MNKKGFSTIELVVSFIIVSFVAIALFRSVLSLLDRTSLFQVDAKYILVSGNITNSIQKDLNQRKLYGIDDCGCNCFDITYQDLTTKRFLVDREKRNIQYGGIAETLPDDFTITGDIDLTRTSFTKDEGKNNTILKISIPILNKITEKTISIDIVHQYDNRDIGDLPPYVEKSTDDEC